MSVSGSKPEVARVSVVGVSVGVTTFGGITCLRTRVFPGKIHVYSKSDVGFESWEPAFGPSAPKDKNEAVSFGIVIVSVDLIGFLRSYAAGSA